MFETKTDADKMKLKPDLDNAIGIVRLLLRHRDVDMHKLNAVEEEQVFVFMVFLILQYFQYFSLPCKIFKLTVDDKMGALGDRTGTTTESTGWNGKHTKLNMYVPAFFHLLSVLLFKFLLFGGQRLHMPFLVLQ